MSVISKIKLLPRYFEHLSKIFAGRRHNAAEKFLGIFACRRLKRTANADTVLLIEFNPWHGEILPGFADYFQKLGYKVAAVVRYATCKDSPFVRMAQKPDVFCMSLMQMKAFLRDNVANSFAYVLVASDRIYLENEGRLVRTLDLNGTLPTPEHGVGIVEHEAGEDLLPTYNEYPSWPLRRQLENAFVLTPCTLASVSLPMLNPCFFGDVKTGNVKNDVVTFITIGSIKTAKRNFSELFEALGKLRGNWRLLIVGSVDDPSCLANLPGQVEVLGRLSFKAMYEKIEESDFILPLLDPDFEGHKHYLESCTSGSRQLILGFAKVPVMDFSFGMHYNFTEECAVLHGKGGLPDAMQRAVDMGQEEYAGKVESLKKEYRRVYDESLANLKGRFYAK